MFDDRCFECNGSCFDATGCMSVILNSRNHYCSSSNNIYISATIQCVPPSRMTATATETIYPVRSYGHKVCTSMCPANSCQYVGIVNVVCKDYTRILAARFMPEEVGAKKSDGEYGGYEGK